MTLDVEEIISKMLSTYAECCSYRDRGRVKVKLNDDPAHTFRFWTSFDKSGTFHSCIIESPSKQLYSSIFGSGLDAFEIFAPEFVIQELEIEEAISGEICPEVCELPRRTLALLLMPHPSVEALRERDNFEYVGLDIVGAEQCHHLRREEDTVAASHLYEMWISTTRFILRKQRKERQLKRDFLLSLEEDTDSIIEPRSHWLSGENEEADWQFAQSLWIVLPGMGMAEPNMPPINTTIEVIHSEVAIDVPSTDCPSAA